jgi:hypothetical protein
MTATAKLMLRWSSVRDCPRKAIYEATNAPHRDRTLKEERQLARGRSVGHEYLVAIAHESKRLVHVATGPDFMLPYPHLRAETEDDAEILAELPVRWELGVGHADAYIRETDTVIEVLSSQSPTAEMIHSKLLQGAGYARALDATSVCLAIVDPATLDDDRVIVTQSSDRWAELMAEVDERIAQVLAWRDRDELPARVCSKPGDSFGHFCQYAGHCFEGWEPKFAEELQSEEAQQLAIRLAHVKAKRRELSSSDKTLEAEQKLIQADLEGFVPGGEWQVGGYLVKRSDRTRSSFKLTLAEQDGRFPDDLLAQFTTRTHFTVWDVEKTGPAVALPDTEEEVPF